MSAALHSTVLADWHRGHSARMVAFGGWNMPLHYPGGITREHVATRTRAGLFDVSHMGRFRIAGSDSEEFVARVLTNDPRTLAVGVAHYSLLATETGGALDDAYLYRLAADEFLLVVNAANRERDWDHLLACGVPARAVLSDVSAALAMLALQGPRSADMLQAVIGAAGLPEARRNRLQVAMFDGHELIVARTGYTGEAQCFELFVPAEAAVALWQRLVDQGAVPAGLGARDSLRLEAGLPLYGHELGVDRDGREIPIFANALARFGVRRPGHGDYPGCAALDAQRGAYDRLMAGAAAPADRRLLTHLVQAIAVFEGRRPLRAGYELWLADELVGYVTSGTSVPVDYGDGKDGEVMTMRPIGLALVRSDIRYRADSPTRFSVRDGRGGSMLADLVARNLPPMQR